MNISIGDVVVYREILNTMEKGTIAEIQGNKAKVKTKLGTKFWITLDELIKVGEDSDIFYK